MERASRSGAHREHDSRLDEGGDELERLGHGEVGGGGASVGSEEEDVTRWHWTARGEASRPGRSGRARRRGWQMQLAQSATARMNFASTARTPAVSRREEKKNDGGGAPIYRREGCVRLRQLPNEVATESEACHRVRKWRRRSAASSYVAPAASI